MKESYEEWLKKVDAAINKKSGEVIGTIDDWDYAGAYDSDMSPEEAADEALENAGFPSEDDE